MNKYEKWQDAGVNQGGSLDYVIPNGYLSYSSIKLLANQERWVEHYIKGNKMDLSHIKAIQVGKEFAEKREFDEEYINKYPSLEKREKHLIVPVTLTSSDIKVCLYTRPDSVSTDYTLLQDDKTYDVNGKTNWNQRSVFGHMQFRLGCLAVYELTGLIPRFRVVAIEMDDGVETGNHHTYEVQYSEADMEHTRFTFTTAVIKASCIVHNNKDLLSEYDK